ncbi:ganglioside-induced differentiation-associated protein 1-like [Saccoglossus kowalevskii]|uniref:Ganglioside-induced differentiation-associated protein 1-like n=1 Tax=Saccoglossus kowalevskii TaxID=10224 RepID=A0ABM0M8W0_SACKO|nr:PREDICTED: ganglioside-induced differentiation-associated protein 1-like [Saccoglossus kowalevskii]
MAELDENIEACDDQLLVYYWEYSVDCQRVLLALEEKKIDYKKIAVNILELENVSPWYMKINPRGEVPTVVRGNDVVMETETILHYLDDTFVETTRLCPDEESEEGFRCKYQLKLASKIDLVKLNFGVPVLPEVAGSDDVKENFTADDVTALVKLFRESLVERCDQLASENPDLSDAYAKKKEWGLAFPESPDAELLDAALKMTNDVLTKLEEDLTTRKMEESPDTTWWLVGTTFTTADIYWATILHRLEQLGLEQRYWANGKRPHVSYYLDRIKQRANLSVTEQTGFMGFVGRVKKRWPWMAVPIGVVAAGLVGLLIL